MNKSITLLITLLLVSIIIPITTAVTGPPIPNVPTTIINEPPVPDTPMIDPTIPNNGTTSVQFELLVKQNATLMQKIDSLKSELNKLATKTQLAETRLDVFEAVEYNTMPTKTILPYATLTIGLFAFLLFIFGSVEASNMLRNRLAQGNLRCPSCGKYAKPINTQKGTVYLCQCNNVYGKVNPKILDLPKDGE